MTPRRSRLRSTTDARRVAAPPRYDILRHIRTLDPQRRDEIAGWSRATSSRGLHPGHGHGVPPHNGRVHAERIEQDLDRREVLDDAIRLVVVTGRGIFREPGRTVERVWRVLRARHLPGLPSRHREEWRAHFPAHD